jgi:hypothetical protein
MTNNDAIKEYNEIKYIKTKLKSIHNYSLYFLIDNLTLCSPSKLNTSDLTNFTKKCKIFKNNITVNNINNKLHELTALNIPYGGLTINEIINTIESSNLINFINKLNKSLINLLINGIIPMNKHHIYHSDIKDSNVLINQPTFYPKLIDWGMTTDYIPFHNNKFPNNWRNKPLIFNSPFSIIIFSDLFVTEYTNFLNTNSIKTRNLKQFISEYLSNWNKTRGEGHLQYINHMMMCIYNNKHISNSNIENNITIPCIVNYIYEILNKYTKFRENHTLDLRKYLDNIFIHNLDIWGFCVIYFPIYELLFINFNKLNTAEIKCFENLKKMFKYLYTTPEKLNCNKIIKILNWHKITNSIKKQNTTPKFNKTFKNKI